MGENSKIEWCDHTFNPWIGCDRVSPGCTNCYAEALNRRHKWVKWGWKEDRKRTSEAYWKRPFAWDAKPIVENGHARKPRVFCASMADWLDEGVPMSWRLDLLHLIYMTQNLNWLLLTKRPENWHLVERCLLDGTDRPDHAEPIGFEAWAGNWMSRRKVPGNVWVGATVENQEFALKRIPELLRIPARIRFLSCEPLLGPVVLPYRDGLLSDYDWAAEDNQLIAPPGGFTYAKINWVIAGGESGPNARPSDPRWFRDIRDQCEDVGTPFFFKQWGEFAPVGPGMDRVGKRAAGRLLDGFEHLHWPA